MNVKNQQNIFVLLVLYLHKILNQQLELILVADFIKEGNQYLSGPFFHIII
jgi:hypothetical protein